MTTADVLARPVRGRNNVRLLAHQVLYEQLSFWRNPQAAIFTFAFPVLFITILGALFGSQSKHSSFGGLPVLEYYIPTIAAMAVLTSCYGQLAVALSARRQNGILKRVRATPLPAWAYFGGLLARCMLVSFVDVGLILLVGRMYGVPLPTHWLAVGGILVLGTASFCSMGVAAASVISNADAAPAVAQLVMFPLLFLSGTYMPISSKWLTQITGWLPVRPFNELLTAQLSSHSAVSGHQIEVLALWGVVGVAVAIRRFRWDPRPE
jgi:ABC-2 type transport system permease protein